MTQPGNQEPVEPYVFTSNQPEGLSVGPVPGVDEIESTVLGNDSSSSIRPGRIVGGFAALALVSGAVITYPLWSGDKTAKPAGVTAGASPTPDNTPSLGVQQYASPTETPAPEDPEYCISPPAKKWLKGDPNSTTDDPDTWKTGVTMSVTVPTKLQGYMGMVFGYTGPDGGVSNAQYSPRQDSAELKHLQLMRTGPEAWTALVAYAGKVGSAACKKTPIVDFKIVKVKDALAKGADEPI